REHAGYHKQPRLGLSNRLLVISWWKDRIMVLQYTVTDDGAYESVRDTPRAKQANRRKTIDEEELKRLIDLLPALPESTAEPPIQETVLVSFQSGKKWRTETYDTANLPDKLEKAMLIIGERGETKDRPKKK